MTVDLQRISITIECLTWIGTSWTECVFKIKKSSEIFVFNDNEYKYLVFVVAFLKSKS